MKKIKRFWWVPILLILAAGGFLVYSNAQYQQRQAAAVATTKTVQLTTGSVTTTVNGTGSVYANQSSTLTWNTTGQVDQVLVKKGDSVKEGQVLASLNSSSLPGDSAILTAKSNLAADQQALEDLKNSNVDLATAQKTLSAAQKTLEDAKRKRSYKNSTTRGDTTAIALAKTNYEVAQKDVDGLLGYYSIVSDKDTDDPKYIRGITQLAAAETYRDAMYNNWMYLKGSFTAKEIADADAAVTQAQANYDDALRVYTRLKNGPSDAEIKAAENKILADQQLLDSINLKAPFDGTVIEQNIYPSQSIYGYTDAQIRDISLSKQTITKAMIIEDLSKVYVDVSISEVSINSIKVGQNVTLTFDGVPGKTYTGKVIQVGQVGTKSSGAVTYTVTVQISNADSKIKMSMTASASIITTEDPTALLAPTKSIQTVNNQKKIYILRNGKAIGITVQTGGVMGTMTQITSSALKAGDAIVEDPTSISTTNNMGLLGMLGGMMGGGPGRGGPPPGDTGGGGPPPGGGPNGGGGPPPGG
jgi:HlyD family secretion protein